MDGKRSLARLLPLLYCGCMANRYCRKTIRRPSTRSCTSLFLEEVEVISSERKHIPPRYFLMVGRRRTGFCYWEKLAEGRKRKALKNRHQTWLLRYRAKTEPYNMNLAPILTAQPQLVKSQKLDIHDMFTTAHNRN